MELSNDRKRQQLQLDVNRNHKFDALKIKLETMTLMHKMQCHIKLTAPTTSNSTRVDCVDPTETQTKTKRWATQRKAHVTYADSFRNTRPSVPKCPHTDKVNARPKPKVTWIVFTNRTIHWNQLQRMLEAIEKKCWSQKRSHWSNTNSLYLT